VILTADKEDPLLVAGKYGTGPRRGLRFRRQGTLGGELAHLARLRPPLGHIFRDLLPHAPQSETTAISTAPRTSW